MENTNMLNSNDHDILIELKTRIEDLRSDIKELKDGTSSQIKDHEIRIKSLENSKTKTNVAMGIYISIGAVLIGLITYHLFGF